MGGIKSSPDSFHQAGNVLLTKRCQRMLANAINTSCLSIHPLRMACTLNTRFIKIPHEVNNTFSQGGSRSKKK